MIQDELAETSIADPGYAGTNYEIWADDYEFEVFEYWDDLEYGDPAYWDESCIGGPGADSGRKRKRIVANNGQAKKRRKHGGQAAAGIEAKDRAGDPVVFLSRKDRHHTKAKNVLPQSDGKQYALFPDWRKRLVGLPQRRSSRGMPTEMRKAAGHGPSTEEEEDGDEECEGEEEEQEDIEGELAIDPAMLMEVLKDKLGQAGLQSLDQSQIMAMLAKLMSGDDDADDVAGQLADSLLEKVTSGSGDKALSNWLSSQGVSLEAEDDEDQALAAADSGQESTGKVSLEYKPSGRSTRTNTKAGTAANESPPSRKRKADTGDSSPPGTRKSRRTQKSKPESTTTSDMPQGDGTRSKRNLRKK